MARGPGIGQLLDQAPAPRRGMSAAAPRLSADQARQQMAAREREFAKNRSRSAGEHAQDLGLSLLGGAVGLGQAAYGVGNLATGGYLDRATGMSENFQETQETLDRWQSRPLRLRRQDANRAFEEEGVMAGVGEYLSNPSLVADLAVEAAPSLLPAVGAGNMAARTVGAVAGREATEEASKRAVLRTVGAQTAGSTNVEAINTLREQGVDEQGQQLGGMIAGPTAGILAPGISRVTGAAGLEARVGSRLAGMPGRGSGVGRVATGAASGTVREGVEEGLQGATERASVNLVAPESDLLEGTGRAAAMGTLAGGPLGTVMGGFGATGQDTSQPAGTAEEARAQAEQENQQAQTQQEVAEALRQYSEAQRAGRPLNEVVDPNTGEPPRAFNPSTGEYETITEQSFLTAQDMAIREMFNVQEDGSGNEVITRFDPDTQQRVEVPRSEAEAAANQMLQERAQAEAEAAARRGEQIALDLGEAPQPQPRPTGTEGVEPVDPETGQQDLFAGPQAGGVSEQPAAPFRPQVNPGRPLQEAVEQSTGVRRPGGMSRSDLVTDEDQALNELFRVGEDEQGRPTYERYNQDLQRMEQVPRGRAVKEAKDLARQRREEEAERNRPLQDRWKDTLARDLGLKKQQLRGRDWDRFVAQANEAGIAPDSEQAGEFLQQQAATLGQDEAGASRFAAAVAENYAPAGEAAVAEEAPLQQAAEQQEPAGTEQITAPTPEGVEQEVQDLDVTERAAEAAESAQAGRDENPVLSQEELVGLQEEIVYEISSEQQARTENRRQNSTKRVLQERLASLESADQVDTNIQAITGLRDFQNLSESDQNEVVQQYSDMYDKLAPGRFMRVNPSDNSVVDYRTRAQREDDAARGEEDLEGPPPARARRDQKRRAKAAKEESKNETTLQAERVQPIVDAVTEGDNTEVRVFSTVAEYREATGQAAPPDAAGVYEGNREDGTGVTSVITENIPTEQKLAEVLAHERGHHGLDALLGDRLPAVTNRLWANASVRGRIRDKMQTEGLDRAGAAEEVLVDMLVSGEQLNQDVFSKLRAGVDSFFQTVLGVGKYRVPDSQVNRILRDTGQYLRTDSNIRVGETALTTSDAVPLDVWLGDPQVIAGSPRFSRVYEELNKVVPETNPKGGNSNNFSRAAREATQASAFRLRDMWRSVRTGSVGREMARFLPLTQMYNLYGRRFQRDTQTEGGENISQNPLKDIRDLTDKQETSFNKRLTQQRTLELDGEQFQTSIHDIAEEASKFQRQDPEATENLNRVLQYGTFYQVWPQKAWEDQPNVDYERLNMTPEERQGAHRKLQQLYSSIGGDGQQLYRKIQASYKDIWNSRISALESELKRINGGELPSQSFVLDVARRSLNGGPYSPLSRHGAFQVQVFNQDGDVVYASAHDTGSEADHTRHMMGQRYRETEGYRVNISQISDYSDPKKGLTQSQIREMENILAREVPDDASDITQNAIRNALIETYLKSLPESSFNNFSNRRQNIDGFSMDGIRAFNEYALKGARQISGIEYDGEIGRSFRQLDSFISDKRRAGENTEVEDQIRSRLHEQFDARAQNNFNRYASAMSGAGFIYMMTSPSQMFVNASQTPLVAFPRLAAQYGAADTLRFGQEALKNFFKGGRDFLSEKATRDGTISEPGRQVMQRLFEEGVLDFTLAHDIADVGNGSSGQLSSGWRKVMEHGSSWIHKSEVFNRQITAYMATQLEMKKRGLQNTDTLTEEQLEGLKAAAKDAVYDTQFNYSQSNKPAMLQGPIRRLVFQFQQFRLNMLAMYAKDLRDAFGGGNATPEEKRLARRSLAYMTGAQLGFTGAVGTAMSPIVFGIMDAFADDDEDFLDSRTAFVEATPTWMAHGLIGGALNMDTSRISMAGILPLLGDMQWAPKDADAKELTTYMLERNIGPWWSLTQDAITGVGQAAGGEFYEASQNLLPKPLADPLRAWNESDGVRTERGTVTYDPGVWDTVNRALGMRSQDQVQSRETQGAGYQAQKRISNQRRKRMTRLAVAYATQDREAQEEAFAEIREWNEKNPQFAIRGQDIGRLRTTQRREQLNADRFGMPMSRNLDPAFREAAGQEE